jgi:ribulose-5-phosphate 4-epimerase/fuculose-1-phosphate aldolase
MSANKLKELEMISRAVGNSPDLVQGGGGNTSVKLDDDLMAVKASGCKLKDITPSEGFVVVNYKNIREYFESVDINEDRDYEKESGEYARANIVPMEGIKPMRPSVEAGFHSVLKKYVIHTHPVYANIICCSKNGFGLAKEIFRSKEYGFIWIPYINPGFSLTLAIRKEINEYIGNSKHFPQVIFMENHGLVVTADKASDCVELHEDVNGTIRGYFDLSEQFPSVGIEGLDDNTFISKTGYLKEYFKDKDLSMSFFENTILYPDQLVYLHGNISLNETGNKMNINTDTGEILYKVGEKEALTMEETLMGFVYVVNQVKKNHLELKTMNAEETAFILNWESEKYRKSLLKDQITQMKYKSGQKNL